MAKNCHFPEFLLEKKFFIPFFCIFFKKFNGVTKLIDYTNQSSQGHGYDSDTGYFTAQEDGLYYFYTNFLRYATAKRIDSAVGIMVNGQRSCRAFAQGDGER